MSNIKLVTDESADVPVELIREFDIGIVKLNVAFGDEDVSHLSNSEFYEKMKKSSILPKTSASSPERFVEQYRTDQDVIVVTLAGKLSSTYSAAKLAKDMHYAEGGKNKIEIIDSFNGCIGASALIYMAGQMAREGKPFEEIVGKVMELRDNLLHYGVLETLENAIKGGRVNRTQGFLANALNIKAVVEIKDSAVKPIDKARGTKNAVKKAEQLLADVGLKDRMNHLPSELSGGERQRVAVARALINSPSLILADEPTGNLDPENAVLISNLLFEMADKYEKTLILVTHDEKIAEKGSEIYKIIQGNLVRK